MGVPPDAREVLLGLDALGPLEPARVDELIDAGTWLQVPAGQRLFSAGDPPDGMYVIVDGRVRFFDEDDGIAVVRGELGPGHTFGEGSLLTGGHRSRTAVVVRDAVLLLVPPEHFMKLLVASPGMAVGVARWVAARLEPARVAVSVAAPPENVVVLPYGVTSGDIGWLVHELAGALDARVVAAPADEPVTAGAERARLVVVDTNDALAVARNVREADRVLVVTAPAGSPAVPIPPLAHPSADPLVSPPVELVLFQGSEVDHPVATALWLVEGGFARHHHLRRRSRTDVARLARHLTGTAVALVLGGGGARGMAHIGVVKAMAELGIPLDHIGGSSIGAIVGGQVAMGWSWQQMLQFDQQRWASRRLRFDVTLPTVSVSSGRRARRILEETFGPLRIEDLWLPFFCTTVNLSRFRLAVHDAGPAAAWVRASASAPGLWPPVVDSAGELHIDGGQLNNVPADVMRLRHRGPIIAVDVCAVQAEMTVPAGTEPPLGLRHLAGRRSRARYPSLVDTLNRCALLGSLQHQETASDHADVYLTPDLSSIGFSGFGRIQDAVEIGYRSALEGLAGWPGPRGREGAPA
jgi:NTE family protein